MPTSTWKQSNPKKPKKPIKAKATKPKWPPTKVPCINPRKQERRLWDGTWGESDPDAEFLENFTRLHHRCLHDSAVMIDALLQVNLERWIKQRNPLDYPRKIKQAMSILGRQLPLPALMNPIKPIVNDHTSWINVAMRALNTTKPRPTPERHVYQGLSAEQGPPPMPTDEIPVVIDTGASYALTPIREDFIDNLVPSKLGSLQGLSSKAKVAGEGTVEWTIYDVNGVIKTVRVRAYYVPSATIRLFSPQVYFHENKGKGKLEINATTALLHLPEGGQLEFPINCHSSLPLMLLKKQLMKQKKR